MEASWLIRTDMLNGAWLGQLRGWALSVLLLELRQPVPAGWRGLLWQPGGPVRTGALWPPLVRRVPVLVTGRNSGVSRKGCPLDTRKAK